MLYIHVLYWFVINTTGYHLGRYSLHLLLLKSSMAKSQPIWSHWSGAWKIWCFEQIQRGHYFDVVGRQLILLSLKSMKMGKLLLERSWASERASGFRNFKAAVAATSFNTLITWTSCCLSSCKLCSVIVYVGN